MQNPVTFIEDLPDVSRLADMAGGERGGNAREASFAQKKFFPIVDEGLCSLPSVNGWLSGFDAFYPAPAGEGLKDLSQFPHHVHAIAQLLEKTGGPVCFLAVGGGSVGDFTGFLASVYKRGVPYIQVPSTLLAAVDSAHGGKTALNLGNHKNQIGTFYEPQAIFICKALLRELPDRELRSGLGEVIKMAFLMGGEFYQQIERQEVYDFENLWSLLPMAIEGKYAVTRSDPYEKLGERQILNLGHTLGHVLELRYGLPHGVAVALGLSFTLEWSRRKQHLAPEAFAEMCRILQTAGLPSREEFRSRWGALSASEIKKSLLQDKKLVSEEQLVFIFLTDPGSPLREVVKVEEVVQEAVRQGWATQP